MYGIQPRLRTSAARSVCHRSHPQGIRLRLHAFRYGAYGKEQFYAGHNEELVGKAIEPFRKEVVLATKFHIGELPQPDETSLYREMRRHLEDSMSRLRTDYIDLYYLHRINETVRLEDVATVMGRLVKEGLYAVGDCRKYRPTRYGRRMRLLLCLPSRTSIRWWNAIAKRSIFPVCLEKGIGVVPFSPIASGFLSGKVTAQEQFGFDDVRKFVPQLSKENIEANRPILDLLHRFAVEKNATNAQISLAWMLHKYPNVVPIPGSKNQERILENLGAWNVTLSGDEFRQLQSALDECKVHGHRGCVETEQTSFGKQWSEETAK